MATRRTTRVEMPVPQRSSRSTDSGSISIDAPPPNHSPFLPTRLEFTLLALYPATLLLGSLFSTLHPSTRAAPYLPTAQSYDPAQAPSYFAKKSNIFNQYFVKIGWAWITLAFATFTLTHASLGPPFRPALTRRRLQAAARYAGVTLVWVGVTQWFFGAPLVDRSFRWTGGQCAVIFSDSAFAQAKREEMSDAREVFTHAACKAVGGTWRGGHDISGHVFLLILGSAMLWLELLPAVLRMEGVGEARFLRSRSGLVRRAREEVEGDVGKARELGIGAKVSLIVAGLSWWMLLMTAAYFHTWFEKLTGLLVAFTAVYVVYFLPRGVPALRQVLGMPGV